ncbi:hypothetical protein ACP70R_044658 [Stipagrostis hirtigluma subsp. patula]
MLVAVAAAVLVVLELSAAAASAMAPATSHCDTRCGDVEVPYPFGITPGCSYPLPGFNLTCDRTRRPPHLLLGDGTLRVVEIFVRNSTVRVVRTGGAVNISRGGRGVWRGAGLGPSSPFVLSPGDNELVVSGCNVQATLQGEDGAICSGCSSFCSTDNGGAGVYADSGRGLKHCLGIGCCQAVIPLGRTSFDVHFVELDAVNATMDGGVPVKRLDDVNASLYNAPPVNIFVADASWFDQEEVGYALTVPSSHAAAAMDVPVVLMWAIWPSEAERPNSNAATVSIWTRSECTDIDAYHRICRSKHTTCDNATIGYTCRCKDGYDGNPYLADGCQDINECDNKEDHGCFGECTNTIGNFTCRCPTGTHGNHNRPNGCITNHTGLIIGLSVGSGPVFLLLAFGVIFTLRKIKQIKVRKLKQKFFKQNRGQLLQQLVSQRADIAERMIIPLDEIEKATNNFDQSRKLGGGGHGTVYKGILSDLHVVAIKKPKIAVQREIKEFINEVAILSQINHRNVVKLLGCCLETEMPLLVYEFISNGTLQDHLHKEARTTSLSWGDRLRIAKETAKAIAYLHSSVSIPIVHRDIKSANILLDDALIAKVSDFGASRYIPVDQSGGTTAIQGTIGYLDPMYCCTGRLTEISDVYSFGVILVELLTRKIPNSYRTPGGDGLVAHFSALLAEGNLVQLLDPQVVDEGGSKVKEVAALAASCIKFNGEERPTMRQVEIALEAFQPPIERVLDDASVGQTEGNIVSSHLLTRRRTNTEGVSRQYSLEEEFIMSARYPR